MIIYSLALKKARREPRKLPERLSHPSLHGEEQPVISLAEQIAEVQRELALRKQGYPQWVQSGKLDASDATCQIKVMEQIVRTLMQLDAEQRQLSLFGT